MSVGDTYANDISSAVSDDSDIAEEDPDMPEAALEESLELGRSDARERAELVRSKRMHTVTSSTRDEQVISPASGG